MEKYIIENKGAFTHELCDEIISSNVLKIGNDNIISDEKNNYYKINLDYSNDKIYSLINSEIISFLKNISKYSYLVLNEYNFIKFEKELGYITYKNDFIILNSTIFSSFNFVIFLNDVEDGGELEISGIYKIIPEKGKLIIFPSGWCFPYSHKPPISNDKYIIYGKIYSKF